MVSSTFLVDCWRELGLDLRDRAANIWVLARGICADTRELQSDLYLCATDGRFRKPDQYVYLADSVLLYLSSPGLGVDPGHRDGWSGQVARAEYRAGDRDCVVE